MPSVWRIRMKSGLSGIDHVAARQYARENNIVGGGWCLNLNGADIPNNFHEYIHIWDQVHHGKRQRREVTNIARDIEIGDFVWTIEPSNGQFYCAKIIGNFQYIDISEYDLHIRRPCEWKLAGVADRVPGGLVRCFLGPFGTISRIKDQGGEIIKYSRYLFEGEPYEHSKNIFDLLSHWDIENLVIMYLQSKGWMVIFSSSSRTMSAYECVLVNSKCERSIVQVKGGHVNIDILALLEVECDKVFVFSLNYIEGECQEDERIEVISPAAIVDFARKHKCLLPMPVQAAWTEAACRP